MYDATSHRTNTIERLIPRQQEIIATIIAQPEYSHATLKESNEGVVLKTTGQSMGGDVIDAGQRQSLRAVIGAGSELFGIVRIDDEHNTDANGHVLTRLAQNNYEQPAIIGVIQPGEALNIGRDAAHNNDPTMSQSHFSVSLAEAGIVIKDLRSTNGTKLFAHETTLAPRMPELEGQVANRALKRLAALMPRRKSKLEPTPKDPLQESTIWAPDPEEVRNLLEPISEQYRFLESLISETAIDTRIAELEAHIHQYPHLKELHRIEQALNDNAHRWGEAHKHNDEQQKKDLDRQRTELITLREGFSEEEQSQYWLIDRELQRLRQDTSIVKATPQQAMKLVSYLENAPSIWASPSASAPFEDYKNMSGDDWQQVDDHVIQNYLASRGKIKARAAGNMLIVDAEQGKPIDVSLSLIVDIPTFSGWQGRTPDYMDRTSKTWSVNGETGEMNSAAVVKKYAGQPTELPPLDYIQALIQPNGKILLTIGNEGSHRTAAAILRGVPAIAVKQVRFHLLDKNIV